MRQIQVENHDIPGFEIGTFPALDGDEVFWNGELWRVAQIMQNRAAMGTLHPGTAAHFIVHRIDGHPADFHLQATAVKAILVRIDKAVLARIFHRWIRPVFGDRQPERIVAQQLLHGGDNLRVLGQHAVHVVVIELADLCQFGGRNTLAFETGPVVAIFIDTRIDQTMALEIVDPARTHFADHAFVQYILEVPVTVSLPSLVERLPVTEQMIGSLQLPHCPGLFQRYGLCIFIVHGPSILLARVRPSRLMMPHAAIPSPRPLGSLST
ncbi:hypothetical protein D3C75_546420 [compost metagenome]